MYHGTIATELAAFAPPRHVSGGVESFAARGILRQALTEVAAPSKQGKASSGATRVAAEKTNGSGGENAPLKRYAQLGIGKEARPHGRSGGAGKRITAAQGSPLYQYAKLGVAKASAPEKSTLGKKAALLQYALL